MNALKKIFPALAFALAIGAVFAFTPVNESTLSTIPAKAPDCTPGQVSDQCSIANAGEICRLVSPLPVAGQIAYDFNATVDCDQADEFKRP